MCRGGGLLAYSIVSYRYFVSDYVLEQYVKTFFKRLELFLLEHTQEFF